MRSLLAIFLIGCGPVPSSSRELQYDLLPKELENCTFHELRGPSREIVLSYCPNGTAATTYRVAKTTAPSIVVDGVTYVPETTD